jgi:N-acetylglucosamine-6-phosphate deacetylase
MADGYIREVAVTQPPSGAGAVWIGPGLVDLQVNGYHGHDFNHFPLAADTVAAASSALSAQGVTSFFPTLVSNTPHAIEQAAREITRARPAARTVVGIHLEGPFISPQDGSRGAHDRAHIRPPDWDLFQRWQDAAEGGIRILTMSPEWEGSARFIERCTASGVLVSIGHTAASPAQIADAVAAGARMSTHLGNGMQLHVPRHPNYLWEQLANDELWASLIADGWHLSPSVLRVMLRAKGDRAFLVSDAVSLSGLAPGEYDLHIGGRVVLTGEGRLHLADRPELLAGSVSTLATAVSYLADNGLTDLAQAWDMASRRPSTAAGLPTAGGLEPGSPADMVLFDWDGSRVRIRATYKRGQLVYDGLETT